jgi:hypothetical protein
MNFVLSQGGLVVTVGPDHILLWFSRSGWAFLLSDQWDEWDRWDGTDGAGSPPLTNGRNKQHLNLTIPTEAL